MQQITTRPRHHTNSSQKQSRNVAYCQGKYSKEKHLIFFSGNVLHNFFFKSGSRETKDWRMYRLPGSCFLEEALTNIVSYLVKVSIIKGKEI